MRCKLNINIPKYRCQPFFQVMNQIILVPYVSISLLKIPFPIKYIIAVQRALVLIFPLEILSSVPFWLNPPYVSGTGDRLGLINSSSKMNGCLLYSPPSLHIWLPEWLISLFEIWIVRISQQETISFLV